MKKRVNRVLSILTLLAVAFSVVAWTVSVARPRLNNQDAQNTGGGKSKTLREIAQERDVETEVGERETSTEYDDLRQLAEHSDAVILGHVSGGESYFSGDNNISTKHEVEVQRIIKDGTAEAALLSQTLKRNVPTPLVTPLYFIRFGGTVQVNGHRASVRLKGSELFKTGQTYILFLQWTGWNYRIAGGMSGAILVEDNLRVKPLGTKKELKLKKYDALDLETFIREISAGTTQ